MNVPYKLFENGSCINGQWISGDNTFAVNNPANGEVIANLHSADGELATLAVDAAYGALPAWRATPAKQRANILRRWYELIIQQKDELAALLTAEQGKPLAEAAGEIVYAANYIEWFAEEAKRIYGDTVPALSSNNRIIVVKQAVGVVAAITPWNFPCAMITRKAAAALAAGCTFIVKPAAETPLSALALATLAQEAGVPAGVFNVIASKQSRQIGDVLTKDSRVAKFSFTGSTEVGKVLLEQCASTVKKVSMELGGNAPFIVFEDADIDEAVKGAIISKYRNAGQTCVCTNRFLVQSSIAKEFSAKLVAAVEQLSLGAGDQPDVDIGPVINEKAANEISDLVDKAIAAGANVVTGGGRSELGTNFLNPTVLTGVTADMDIAKGEIFGPIATLIEFDSEEQAIEMANDTNVGLACYFYTRDIGRVWRLSEALEYGMIGINEGLISNESAPFGGIKESGIGREGSKHGLDDYLELKYLCMGGLNV